VGDRCKNRRFQLH